MPGSPWKIRSPPARTPLGFPAPKGPQKEGWGKAGRAARPKRDKKPPGLAAVGGKKKTLGPPPAKAFLLAQKAKAPLLGGLFPENHE